MYTEKAGNGGALRPAGNAYGRLGRWEQSMALEYDRLNDDTIAAAATGLAEAGIGIIRISGPDAIGIADKIIMLRQRNRDERDLFSGKKRKTLFGMPSNQIRLAYVVDPKDGRVMDEVMVSVFRHPYSYTTEDTVEINTHGGVYLMQTILELVIQNGARPAEPGEFTKRAFLGGRIDLSRAEAVMDLISAGNEFSRRTSMDELRGSVSDKVKELRKEVLYEIAFIESALDDPDNYSLDGYPHKLEEKVTRIADELKELIIYAKEGRILKEGINTVIVGKPNAGKSSLLNYLCGSERAIVTEVAGTTRDTLEEKVRIGNAILNITDTAGIRDTEDVVEKIGVERAKKAMEKADLILFLLDSSAGIEEEDRRIADLINKEISRGKRCILLLNKTDLPSKITQKQAQDLFRFPNPKPSQESSEKRINNYRSITFLTCSLKEREGLDRLKKLILEMFRAGEIMEKNEVFLSNLRQIHEAEKAEEALRLVIKSIQDGLSEDFYSIDLMNAYTFLGRIIGEAVEDDLVEEIFSRFCLGK